MNDSSLSLSGIRFRTRNLVTAYVNHSKSTGLWITTIYGEDRNLKNGRSTSVKAFSFRCQKEAKETAYVNAPPKMMPFDNVSCCYECDLKFHPIFRRPCHCRNCGVCICSTCSITWSKAMVPETYNPKNARTVRVCKACNYLSREFRRALINGDLNAAKKIYMTGNINLRCPFTNVKKGSEIMLPVHCAAVGGNRELVSWLVDIHHCPIKMINTGNNRQMESTLISTSHGRTVLDIALDYKRIDVLKYFVAQKNISISESKGDKNNATYATLEALLRTEVGPESSLDYSADSPSPAQASPRTPKFKRNVVKVNHLAQVSPNKERMASNNTPTTPSPKYQRDPPPLSHRPLSLSNTPSPKYRREPPPLSYRPLALSRTRTLSNNDKAKKVIKKKHDNGGSGYYNNGIPVYDIEGSDSEQENFDKTNLGDKCQSFDDDESVATTVEDECIICCSRSIDCVFTPCGHQVSCLKCSNNLLNCPICCNKATVVKIFRP
mmetsp:Transcript_8237/g.15513  ORF Transcript_8237/g.15513 Transcript_8237/m.15513 type:complete len:493 (-) Transcript_8237:4886-6364(-)